MTIRTGKLIAVLYGTASFLVALSAHGAVLYLLSEVRQQGAIESDVVSISMNLQETPVIEEKIQGDIAGKADPAQAFEPPPLMKKTEVASITPLQEEENNEDISSEPEPEEAPETPPEPEKAQTPKPEQETASEPEAVRKEEIRPEPEPPKEPESVPQEQARPELQPEPFVPPVPKPEEQPEQKPEINPPEKQSLMKPEPEPEPKPEPEPELKPKPKPRPQEKVKAEKKPRLAERKPVKRQRKWRKRKRANRRSGYLAKVNAPGRLIRGATRGAMKGPRQTSTGARISLRQVRQYGALVRARIARYRPRGSGRCRVVIAFSLSPSGGLRAARIASSTCSTRLAQAALSSVRRAAPFPRPPAGIRAAQLRFSIPFSFR